MPQNQGTVLQSRRGFIFGDVDISWWSSQIKNLETTADPTHLPIYLSDSILLYIGSPGNCCVLGYHGTNSTVPIQTYSPVDFDSTGLFGSGILDTAVASHEVGEWMNDPFGDNPTPPKP